MLGLVIGVLTVLGILTLLIKSGLNLLGLVVVSIIMLPSVIMVGGWLLVTIYDTSLTSFLWSFIVTGPLICFGLYHGYQEMVSARDMKQYEIRRRRRIICDTSFSGQAQRSRLELPTSNNSLKDS